MKKVFLALTLVGVIISCDDDEGVSLNENSFLIFGHFYGECLGEACVETFKLTDTQLFEDTLDDYSGKNLEFAVLENAKFELVKDLPNFFPEKLLLENEDVQGCPDCADGGGLFIQYSKNGNVKDWRIDQDKRNVPEYLHHFIDKVNEKIRLINN